MKKTAFTLFGALLGAALGVPLSYYFQPEVVQRKLTLPKYLSELPKIFEDANPDYIVPFVLSCVICTLALGIVGYFVGRASTSTETTSSEQAGRQN
jgi:VIT1/CCC1 family predicted Fe2+/Mn2+ transporter